MHRRSSLLRWIPSSRSLTALSFGLMTAACVGLIACGTTPPAPSPTHDPVSVSTAADPATRDGSAIVGYRVHTKLGEISLAALDKSGASLVNYTVTKVPGVHYGLSRVPSMVIVMEG